MGVRKAKGPQHRLLIQMSKAMYRALQRAAELNERTVTAEIRFLIRQQLERMGIEMKEEETHE